MSLIIFTHSISIDLFYFNSVPYSYVESKSADCSKLRNSILLCICCSSFSIKDFFCFSILLIVCFITSNCYTKTISEFDKSKVVIEFN